MPQQKKAWKPGRPRAAKGRSQRQDRASALHGDLKSMEAAAKSSGQVLSEWIRSTVSAKLNG